MPAVSSGQRALMALAEHHPEKVSKKNKGVLKMSKKQLHDFASTKGLKKDEEKDDHKENLSRGYRKMEI